MYGIPYFQAKTSLYERGSQSKEFTLFIKNLPSVKIGEIFGRQIVSLERKKSGLMGRKKISRNF